MALLHSIPFMSPSRIAEIIGPVAYILDNAINSYLFHCFYTKIYSNEFLISITFLCHFKSSRGTEQGPLKVQYKRKTSSLMCSLSLEAWKATFDKCIFTYIKILRQFFKSEFLKRFFHWNCFNTFQYLFFWQLSLEGILFVERFSMFIWKGCPVQSLRMVIEF